MAFLKENLRPNLAITKEGYKKHDTALKALINFLAIENKELQEGRSKTRTLDQNTPGHLLPEPKVLA